MLILNKPGHYHPLPKEGLLPKIMLEIAGYWYNNHIHISVVFVGDVSILCWILG